MGIGMKELLIILAIALLVFGAKKLKTIGSDLGGAVKGFKKAMNEGDEEEQKKAEDVEKLREGVMLETLTSIRRAGASVILTYWAAEAARLLRSRY